MIANVIVFLLIAVAGGLGSSWYMIERGSALTTRSSGPWRMWKAAGREDADPYTRAHFMRRGMLPVSSALVSSYEAQVDDEGQRLHSSCEYLIEGEEPKGKFWSLAVFDEQGRLIPNPAERYAFNSATLLRSPGGRLSVSLARNARPGNWLPTGGAGRISLTLAVDDARDGPAKEVAQAWQPPTIRRVSCR